MASFVQRFRWVTVGAAASVALLTAGVTLLVRDSRPADSGAAACRMMAADKAAGRIPDGARSGREAQLLQSSRNADLRGAPAALSLAINGDGFGVWSAMDKLYAGCASLGVRLG